MQHPPDVRVVESRQIHSGRVFDVLAESVRLPSGLRQDLTLVDHPGAVAIAATTDAGEVVLVRQYRHAVGRWMLEIPAGRLERGGKEPPLDAARRELEEETGLRARYWRVLQRFYPAPGFCSEAMTVFHAFGLTHAGATRKAMDSDEELETVRVGFAEAARILAADAKSWIALQRLISVAAS